MVIGWIPGRKKTATMIAKSSDGFTTVANLCLTRNSLNRNDSRGILSPDTEVKHNGVCENEIKLSKARRTVRLNGYLARLAKRAEHL